VIHLHKVERREVEWQKVERPKAERQKVEWQKVERQKVEWQKVEWPNVERQRSKNTEHRMTERRIGPNVENVQYFFTKINFLNFLNLGEG
jgi:hypothetical protein